MNVQQYLDRINYKKTLKVSKETLFELQETYLLNVPFENLDIATNNGRIMIRNCKLKITEGDTEKKRNLRRTNLIKN